MGCDHISGLISERIRVVTIRNKFRNSLVATSGFFLRSLIRSSSFMTRSSEFDMATAEAVRRAASAAKGPSDAHLRRRSPPVPADLPPRRLASPPKNRHSANGSPTVDIDLQPGSDTGVSDTDNLTADNTPTFDVTVNEPGLIEIDCDGDGTPEASWTVPAAGTYAYTAQGVNYPGRMTLIGMTWVSAKALASRK